MLEIGSTIASIAQLLLAYVVAMCTQVVLIGLTKTKQYPSRPEHLRVIFTLEGFLTTFAASIIACFILSSNIPAFVRYILFGTVLGCNIFYLAKLSVERSTRA